MLTYQIPNSVSCVYVGIYVYCMLSLFVLSCLYSVPVNAYQMHAALPVQTACVLHTKCLLYSIACTEC